MVYVADYNNNRVQKFTPEGKLLAVIDSKGEGGGRLNRPHGLCVDANGILYVTELQSNTVSIGRHGSASYVGMARKQNGGYNVSISVQTMIFHLVVNSTRLKTVRSALWRCPNTTVALRLLENVVKVTNLEVVKIVFRRDSTSLPTPVLPTHILPTKGLDVSFRLQKFSRLHFESLTLC